MRIVLLGALVFVACGKSGDKSGGFSRDEAKIAEITVKKFAFEAYPQWSIKNPSMPCPKSLADLTPFMNSNDTTDPWGHPYMMLCGSSAPPGAKGFGVLSFGPDGKSGGGDDLDSWSN